MRTKGSGTSSFSLLSLKCSLWAKVFSADSEPIFIRLLALTTYQGIAGPFNRLFSLAVEVMEKQRVSHERKGKTGPLQDSRFKIQDSRWFYCHYMRNHIATISCHIHRPFKRVADQQEDQGVGDGDVEVRGLGVHAAVPVLQVCPRQVDGQPDAVPPEAVVQRVQHPCSALGGSGPIHTWERWRWR